MTIPDTASNMTVSGIKVMMPQVTPRIPGGAAP